MSLFPDSLSINELNSACQNDIHGEVGSVWPWRPTHFHLSIRTTPSSLLLPVAAVSPATRRGDTSSPSVVHRKQVVTGVSVFSVFPFITRTIDFFRGRYRAIAVAFVGGRAPPTYSDWTTGFGVRGSRWELYFGEASPSRQGLVGWNYISHQALVLIGEPVVVVMLMWEREERAVTSVLWGLGERERKVRVRVCERVIVRFNVCAVDYIYRTGYDHFLLTDRRQKSVI